MLSGGSQPHPGKSGNCTSRGLLFAVRLLQIFNIEEDHFLQYIPVNIGKLLHVEASLPHFVLSHAGEQLLLFGGTGVDIERDGRLPGREAHHHPVPLLAAAFRLVVVLPESDHRVAPHLRPVAGGLLRQIRQCKAVGLLLFAVGRAADERRHIAFVLFCFQFSHGVP